MKTWGFTKRHQKIRLDSTNQENWASSWLEAMPMKNEEYVQHATVNSKLTKR